MSPLKSRWTHIEYPESGDSEWGVFKPCRWNVYSLDVWGNAQDGYEVNDRSKIGNVLLPPDYTNEALLKILKADGLINYSKKHLRRIEIEGDEFSVSINYDGRPMFQLDRV